eukprot:c15590_g1_i1.p1 GENE.c15590_g1_i1~~c15590_g1_i1.p1  ORF type:complete len:122 (-),score=18.28 c15590_g1_i1:206-571(-)
MRLARQMHRSWTITYVGFQRANMSATHKDPCGVPPNSPDTSVLDAGVFGEFEQKYREADPQNINDAMRVAKRIWREISISKIQTYIDGHRARLQEIINNNGGATSWQRGGNPSKQREGSTN